ncbi:MAG TPA: glycosyltransferase family 1 protein, partial [Bryobacterales bacterium]|nr:glycosyltransferase family 1 protein [Bryobacterales bacterium]
TVKKRKKIYDQPKYRNLLVNRMSRHVVSHTHKPYQSRLEKTFNKFRQRVRRESLALRARMGIPEHIYPFDPTGFEDFVWNAMFSRSLPASDYARITRASFAVLQPPWDDMHMVGMSGMVARYPLIDSRGYDFFVGQTPYPARFPRRTRLLIRYHDAIPIFLPHTIDNVSIHQAMHFRALRYNVKKGAHFICTSESTRSDLLRVFPHVEDRTSVIHDVVSHNYYHESAPRERLAEIIKSRIDKSTEPKFLTSREKIRFYETSTKPGTLRYIMVVSTIEPRKNHLKLIGAWEILREKVPGVKLLIIGSRGWNDERTLEAMRPWQERGELFHLSRVPAADLRVLYNGADAVVCPSRAEGFDLSGIEAMLCGGVVVASDIPVHREVYADNCEYFNPYSTLDMSKALLRIVSPEGEERRRELIERGLEHAKRYRKDNIAPKWEELLHRLRG